MEYTINKLAKLSGVSSRTLRYYDEIDLLKPKRVNSSNYRIYSEKEVDQLQQILFYRELGMDLNRIKDILSSNSFDEISALLEHRNNLMAEKEKINLLIANVDKTLAYKKGEIKMSDIEKFEAFKQNQINENEERYGKEIREKYGDHSINASNKMLKNMTKEQYEELEQLSSEVLKTLKLAFETKNPSSELAQKTADLHRQWLCYYWTSYSKEAHANLAQMYVDDERFKAYYDKEQEGLAEFLRDAILIYTNEK